jgi:hypothetical protein
MIIFQESLRKTASSGTVGITSKTLLYGVLIAGAVIGILYYTKNKEKI